MKAIKYSYTGHLSILYMLSLLFFHAYSRGYPRHIGIVIWFIRDAKKRIENLVILWLDLVNEFQTCKVLVYAFKERKSH